MTAVYRSAAIAAALTAFPVVLAAAALQADQRPPGPLPLFALPPLLFLAVALVAGRRHRRDGRAAPLALTLMAVHLALGLAAVGAGAPLLPASSYLLTAMAAFAMALALATESLGRAAGTATEGRGLLAAAALLAVSALLVTGIYVNHAGAAFACRGWPLCNGAIFPAGDRLTDINALHRFTAATAAVLIATLLWRTLRARAGGRLEARLATAVALLYLLEVVAGALWGWADPGVPARAVHLLLAALVWAGLVAITTLTLPLSPHWQLRPALRSLAAYVNLTKPRIIELLLVTTVPAMVLAARGLPSPWLILATLVGGTLTAGGANAINCFIDRDIDQVMKRTSRRSLPAQRVSPERALAFGVAIGVAGFLELAALVNLLAAVLAVSAILFYVFVYTLWLKRSTVQNIVIGGAAGAIPPVVGWAAVTGSIDLPAVVLFVIIFVWTPPHFWALALRYRTDYAAAGVPMLPVARGERETRRQIFLYSVVLVLASVMLFATGGAGLLYLVVALTLGGALMRMAWQLLRRGDSYPVMKLFGFSITYLAVLFGAMVVDQTVRSLV